MTATELLILLFKAGANIEAKDKNGNTPLIAATRQRHRELLTLTGGKG